MARRVTVLGAGPGGYVAAVRAAQLGGEVTLIERDRVGGTCLNWGCIPSKVLKTSADMLARLQRPGEYGLAVTGSVSVHLESLMARKETVVRNQVKGIEDLLARHRIRTLKGTGRVDPEAVEVRSPGGGTIQVPWDTLILAPGSRPLEMPAFLFDGDRILSSNDALSPNHIPESLLIVGGGVIGCEFASIYASLGTRVILVEGMSRLLPLPSVDEECSKVLQREMKKRKIDFHVGRTLQGLDEMKGGLRAVIGPSATVEGVRQREPFMVEVEKVLVAVGRRGNTEGLGLEEMGIRLSGKEWIVANERMETGLVRVYAIGDALGPSRPMLAHVASREGLVAAENAMGEKRVMSYDVVPAAIFTTPEIACVGLTEAQARERSDDVRADVVLFRNLAKSHVIGEIGGMAKIVSQVESGRILGVHVVGPRATDLIGEGALALKMGCTVKNLAETVHPHPTLGEILMEVSLKAMDRGIHG